MTAASPIVEAAAQLRAALEETAQALADADQERLLRGELALQLALDRLSAPAGLHDPASRAALRIEVERMREALLRCRQLGEMLLDVVRMSLEAQGRTLEYGRRELAPPPQPPRVHARG
jgi:hypothetical protein